MNIGIISSKIIGLEFGLLCENGGHNILISDDDNDYVYNLNSRICSSHEPMTQRYLFECKNFSATTDNFEVISKSDIIFIFTETPPTLDGNYDTSNIFSIVDEFLKVSHNDISIYNKQLVICSTTNPGDCEKIQKILEPYVVHVGYLPISTPRVDIIKTLQTNNNILIGTKYYEVSDSILSILRDIQIPNIKSHTMSLTASEISKIAVNSFLATKISFANMIGELLINSGLSDEIDIVLHSIGNNSSVGHEYLKYGFGYGGRSLPMDTIYMKNMVDDLNPGFNFFNVVDNINKNHNNFLKNYFISKNPNKSVPFVIDFLSYKKNMNDIESSQRFQLCIDLLEEGYSVYVTNDNLLSSKLNYISEKYNNRLKFYSKSDSIVGYKINL